MDVFLSDQAAKSLKELSKYLVSNWSRKVKSEFLGKLDAKIVQISSQPESCRKSVEFEGIYKCVVTKQTTFYYRVQFEKEEIEIIALFDSRQNPLRLKGQLK